VLFAALLLGYFLQNVVIFHEQFCSSVEIEEIESANDGLCRFNNAAGDDESENKTELESRVGEFARIVRHVLYNAGKQLEELGNHDAEGNDDGEINPCKPLTHAEVLALLLDKLAVRQLLVNRDAKNTVPIPHSLFPILYFHFVLFVSFVVTSSLFQ